MAKSNIVKVNKNCKIIDFDITTLPIKDVLSYSRIDCFKSCAYRYKIKYIEKNYTNDSSLALRIGSILHLGMEFKYQNKFSNKEIIDIVHNGYIEDNGTEVIGLNKLKEDYPFDWEEEDNFGRTYDEKIKLYINRVNSPIEDEWECIGCEVEFHIVLDNRAVIKGFIDRIDKHKNTGEIRVVDYKSSKKAYDKKDLATPMQMFIYALACKEIYGEYPTQYVYDMILIGEMQNAMTKGWEKRGFKTLLSKLDALILHNETENILMKPSSTPLCYWCSYCANNPNATNGKDLCEYYSLWTPTEKTFRTNKQWISPIEESDEWGDSWE